MHNTGKEKNINNFQCAFPWFINMCCFNFIESSLTKEICQYIQNNTVPPVPLWYLVYRLSAPWNYIVYGKYQEKENMISQKKIKMQYLSKRGFITQGKCKINF